MSLSSLLMLGFYEFNNVVSDNGADVEPLKILYTITLLLGIVMIFLILYTKKTAVIFTSLYGIMMIISGIRGNSLQVITGIIILLLVFNKSILKYTGFIKGKKKIIHHKK